MTGYFSEIWRLRYFWFALVRIDLKKRYRRSIIGIGWSLLHPIAMTAVLCVVFGQLYKLDMRSFGPFLMSGLTFWGFFAAAVMEGCHCFFQGESYIRQHPAPLAIYPLRTTLGAGFHFLLGFAIAMIFAWSMNGFGNLPVLLTLLPTFVLLFILGWSLAVCMGVANVLFQDSQHLIEVAMQILFYVTPIIYKPEMLLQRRLGGVVHIPQPAGRVFGNDSPSAAGGPVAVAVGGGHGQYGDPVCRRRGRAGFETLRETHDLLPVTR